MILNNELKVTFPETFHVMNEEELKKLRFLAKGDGVVLSDPERHIRISVAWKKIGAFSGLVLTSGDVAKCMRRSIRKAMAAYRFRAEEPVRTELGGKRADGLTFEYEAENVQMVSESLVVKNRRTLYYFHFYTRAEEQSRNRDIWDQVLASVQRVG